MFLTLNHICPNKQYVTKLWLLKHKEVDGTANRKMNLLTNVMEMKLYPGS